MQGGGGGEGGLGVGGYMGLGPDPPLSSHSLALAEQAALMENAMRIISRYVSHAVLCSLE